MVKMEDFVSVANIAVGICNVLIVFEMFRTRRTAEKKRIGLKYPVAIKISEDGRSLELTAKANPGVVLEGIRLNIPFWGLFGAQLPAFCISDEGEDLPVLDGQTLMLYANTRFAFKRGQRYSATLLTSEGDVCLAPFILTEDKLILSR